MTYEQLDFALDAESSPADGPARISAWRAVVSDWVAHVRDSSSRSFASRPIFGPGGSSWRTSLAFCRRSAPAPDSAHAERDAPILTLFGEVSAEAVPAEADAAWNSTGGAMGAVLGSLVELGYGVAYRVLDAQHFGVPQRRRRVVIVGCLGDWAAPAQVLLEPDGREGNPATRGEPPTIASALTRSGVGGGGGPDDNAAQANHLIATTITREGKGPDSDATTTLIGFDAAQITSGENRSNPRPGDPQPTPASGGQPHIATVTGGEVTHALTAEGADASEDGTGRGTPVVAFGHADAVGPYPSETAGTVRAGHNVGGGAISSAASVRRLTPVECERLQGYPDGWTATSGGREQSDSARYRQLGNSIAVPVFAWVARRLGRIDRETR